MEIAVIGIGNVGGTLARLWTSRGHTVWAGVRDAASDRARRLQRESSAHITSVADAVAKAGMVALCVAWPDAEAGVRAAGDLAGKILIDSTNPLRPDLKGLELGLSTSAAEKIAAWAPGARVVKAFNTMGAMLLGNAQFGSLVADGYYCGDDAAAKEAVRPLIADAGLDPVDVGPLTSARTLEPLALLWVDLKFGQGWKGEYAFKLLRR